MAANGTINKAKQTALGGLVGAAVGFMAIVGAGQLVFATKVEMKDECAKMRAEFRVEVEKLRKELRADLRADHLETMKGLDRVISRIDSFHGGP